MSIRVRAQHPSGAGGFYPDGDGWRLIEDGSLDVLAGSQVIATHAAGHWQVVYRMTNEAANDGPQDGDPEAAHVVIPPGNHRLWLLGEEFEITSADYRLGGDTATLHAKRRP